MTLRCHLCRSDRLMSPWNDGDKWLCKECGASMVYPAVILERRGAPGLGIAVHNPHREAVNA